MSMDTAMDLVLTFCGLVLGISASLLVVRMTMGPTTLDRAIALEVIVSVLIVGIGIEAAVHQHTTTLPLLLVLTTVGFVGSVSIARFARHRGGVTGEPS